jgi:hypothetical protein
MDGSRQVDVTLEGAATLRGAITLGQQLAELALEQHADDILLEQAP